MNTKGGSGNQKNSPSQDLLQSKATKADWLLGIIEKSEIPSAYLLEGVAASVSEVPSSDPSYKTLNDRLARAADKSLKFEVQSKSEGILNGKHSDTLRSSFLNLSNLKRMIDDAKTRSVDVLSTENQLPMLEQKVWHDEVLRKIDRARSSGPGGAFNLLAEIGQMFQSADNAKIDLSGLSEIFKTTQIEAHEKYLNHLLELAENKPDLFFAHVRSEAFNSISFFDSARNLGIDLSRLMEVNRATIQKRRGS